MSHWRFINNWKSEHGIWTFSLFHVWVSREFAGICVLNFAIEYARLFPEFGSEVKQ